MKNLNKFVLEKLKVNSKTKINKNDNIESKEIIDRMIYYFNIDPKDTTDKEEKKDYESLKNQLEIILVLCNMESLHFYSFLFHSYSL